MANGWVVQVSHVVIKTFVVFFLMYIFYQESSGVFNNQPILLRIDSTVKDSQGYTVFEIFYFHRESILMGSFYKDLYL